jgi:pimeloyl-ACP methyl ester carboxylesterase
MPEGAGVHLPRGRRVHLDGRGTTFVREVEGPPGAPTLVLVHGWMASSGLNWFTTFDALAPHFHVLAVDLRGHGRGIRSRRRFRLADCADDLAALLPALGVDSAIFVGYSMGGPVVQLVWRRHPELVDGLVLAATGDCFVDATRDRLVFASTMAVAANAAHAAGVTLHLPTRGVRRLTPRGRAGVRDLRLWAMSEARRHDWATVFQAGQALGTYDARRWVGSIDVPTSVVVTMRDGALPPHGQLDLAARIPGATVHRVDAGHTVCMRPQLAPPLLAACLDVAGRVGAPAPTPEVPTPEVAEPA